MFCCECGNEMRFTDEPITEQFRGETITVHGISRYVCDECGNDVMPASEATKLSMKLAEEYAKKMGLLAPEEIKEIRKSINLTQSEFERIVGVSSPTVCRWERGTSIQSKSTDLLLRLMRDIPGVSQYLKVKAGISVQKITPRRSLQKGASPTETSGWGLSNSNRNYWGEKWTSETGHSHNLSNGHLHFVGEAA